MSTGRGVGDLIFEHCAAITSSIKLTDVLGRALAAVGDIFPGSQSIIMRHEGGVLRSIASHPRLSREGRLVELRVGSGLVGLAVKDRRAVYSPDVRSDERANPQLALDRPDNRSALAVPLTAGEDLIGGLMVLSGEVDAFAEKDAVLLLALAPAIATAIRNALVLQRERRLWDQRRALDARKRSFMRRVAADLGGPLHEIKYLCETAAVVSDDEVPALGERILVQSRVLTEMIEDALAMVHERPST